MNEKTIEAGTVATMPENTRSQHIAPMVQMVAQGQITIEQLDHLMGLQERHEALESKRLYNAAMANFRAEVPPALRDGTGQNGAYATFGSVMNAINGPLGRNGFNVGFKHNQDLKENTLTVICSITHAGGHAESTDLTIKVDKLGSANAVQSLGGTVSYLKRYTVSSLTGLATEDDDGRSFPPTEPLPMLDESDMLDLKAVCEEVGKDYGKYLTYMETKVPVFNGVLQIEKGKLAGLVDQIRRSAKVAS